VCIIASGGPLEGSYDAMFRTLSIPDPARLTSSVAIHETLHMWWAFAKHGYSNLEANEAQAHLGTSLLDGSCFSALGAFENELRRPDWRLTPEEVEKGWNALWGDGHGLQYRVILPKVVWFIAGIPFSRDMNYEDLVAFETMYGVDISFQKLRSAYLQLGKECGYDNLILARPDGLPRVLW
jgi:hypothetical protein